MPATTPRIKTAAVAARLAPLRTLRMDSRQLVENFPPPQLIKQVAEGRRAMPSDKTERAIYQSQVEKYQQRQEKKAAKVEPEATNTVPSQSGAEATCRATRAAVS